VKQRDDRFQTHIREPRWQQIASIALVVGGFFIWLLVVLFAH
jgi:hypothetical protein